MRAGGSSGTTRRTTKVAAVGTTRQVASVTLADGSIIRLTYDANHVGRLITSTDPRGTTTTFVYDSAGKLATATIGMKGVGSDLTTKITASASQGMHGTVAVDTAVVATRIDGPRTDVGDTTVIRVTPFGAPRRITDALGHITRLDYRNASFPALVTHEHRLDAAASLAVYDAKGHLATETDSTTFTESALGARTYATTTYQWDNIWDQVIVIAPPLHDSTVMTYDATTGNRLTQRDVAGDTVFYGYNTSGRLVSVRDTTHAKADSLTYDALGNVASTITPIGFVTRSFRDATGRDTLVTSPIDSAQTVFTSSRTVYDLADRPTLTQSFGPKVVFFKSRSVTDSTPPETLSVTTVYDSGGLVRRVTRKARPDLARLDSLVTRTGYDPAGRKTADTATDGAVETYHYDMAGHVVEWDNRNGTAVTSQYDALGELLTRQMTGRTPDTIGLDVNFEAWVPSDFASNSGDFSTFTYDAAGRMLTADNDAALVHRSYAPNGELLTDSLSIGTWAEDDYTLHDYVLTHSYDLDGRRVTTRGVDADSVAYDLAGRVTGIQDHGGRWFHYLYDRMGRPDTVTDPNGVQLTSTYDAQDRLIRRREFLPAKDSVIHDDTLSYDARGKVLHALGVMEDDYEGYSALGTLWTSNRDNTQIGPLLQNDERFNADAMGNVVWRTVVRNGGSGGIDSTGNTYAALTGRLTGLAGGSLDTTAYNYTAGGDRKYVSGLSGGGRTESQYYYRADGLLIAVDNRSCATNVCKPVNGFPPSSLHGAFEDYRYDALGRRVLVRTRKDHVCEGSGCESSMMWLVFDGSAIAAEIRGPGHDSIPVDSLEAGPGSGPMYGTVDYLNGPNLDEPLEIQGIEPYRTWRGLIDGGQCLEGVCGNSGVIDYPGLTYEAYLTVRPSTQGSPVSWHGSLFAEGQDDGGLMYRRNRYYDPATGQFTQEDPLGLAGGLNAYGFAKGDPMSYSDPFGLCPGISSSYNLLDCPSGYLELLGTLTGILTGGAAGAGAGFLAAAPTGEVASPATVPALALAGAIEGGITGFGMAASLDATLQLTKANSGPSGGNKRTSVNQLNSQIRRGQAPKSVTRADVGKVAGEQDHIHFGEDALNADGTWKHGGRALTNEEKDWLKSNGWTLPPR